MQIDFGEVVDIRYNLDGSEEIVSTVYAEGRESSIRREIKMTEACHSKDEVLKQLLNAAGLVEKYGSVKIEIKQGRVNKPYLVTSKWCVNYEKKR